MANIRIRQATWEDLSHILHQRRAMYEAMGWSDQPRLNRMQDATQEYLWDALPNGNYRAWLAETDDGLVVSGGGIAIVPWPGAPDFPANRRGWILGIYTEPEFRRMGLARRIMDAILEWCRSEGFAHVSLHASKEGRALYEAMGFRPTNEMRLYLE